MIKILLFASLRDAVGVAELSINHDDGVKTVADVLTLAQGQNAKLKTAMQSGAKLMVAVNQDMARFDASVTDGDEIALLPPVTGG